MVAIEPDLMQVIRAVAAMETFCSDASMGAFLDGPVAEILRERIERRFTTEGDDATGGWAPLTEETQAWREYWARKHGWAIGPEHPINERTGDLKHWLEGNGFLAINTEGPTYTLPGEPTGLYPDWLETKLRTAQTGEGATAARPVLGLSDVDAGLVAEAIGEWFLATTAAFGVEVS